MGDKVRLGLKPEDIKVDLAGNLTISNPELADQLRKKLSEQSLEDLLKGDGTQAFLDVNFGC